MRKQFRKPTTLAEKSAILQILCSLFQKKHPRLFLICIPEFTAMLQGFLMLGISVRNLTKIFFVRERRSISYFPPAQSGCINTSALQATDNIICTHVFPALALTEMRRQHPCLQLVTSHISTDYTCAPCTADSALDWYFIPSTSLLGEFEQCGLQPQKLIASGIPVRQQFYQRVSQEAGKANAGISPAHQHILMMCGSMGCGPMEEIISYLCPYLTTEQELSVVCGTNDDLRKKLQKRTEKYSQVHVLGNRGIMCRRSSRPRTYSSTKHEGLLRYI